MGISNRSSNIFWHSSRSRHTTSKKLTLELIEEAYNKCVALETKEYVRTIRPNYEVLSSEPVIILVN